MAIRDLLWACPVCHAFGTLQAKGRGRTEECSACSATLRRDTGALIRIVARDGAARVASAAELEAELPPVDSEPEGGVLGPEPVLVRTAGAARAVRSGRTLIGWAERFGPPTPATASLDPLSFVLQPSDGLDSQRMEWQLETITAVQPSSSTLQIKADRQPVVSIRFLASSVRRWEAMLHHRIAERARACGRGEVVQFHPRIRFR